MLRGDGFILHENRNPKLANLELQIFRPGFGSEPDIYRIPSFVDTQFLRILTWESGPKNGNEAQVACDFVGRRMWPLKILRGGVERNVLFSMPWQCATVTASLSAGFVTIRQHKLFVDGLLTWIESKTVWAGALHKMPKDMKIYHPAGEAAVVKAHCGPPCEHAHFIADYTNDAKQAS